ncbi:MAG: DUF3089 domain-containing protein [Proteobacteria bacterium]|nr:DUF3089 domain-containing protein [Pseudomonadota bacterium]
MVAKKASMKCFLSITAVIMLLAGCAGDRIDYSVPESWYAMPGMNSTALFTPVGSGLSNLEESAPVDVFYVHPTTYYRSDVKNAPIDDPDAVKITEIMLMAQATPFNAIGRIYAPRYRQIALYVYDGSEEEMQEPLNFAFEDVRQAFRYYIRRLNNGRPFIIAGHSQGANHASRLLLEEVIGTPLEKRFVAAWTPGMPIARSFFDSGATDLKPCTAPQQTGCIAIWETFGEGVTDYGRCQWLWGQVYWEPKSQRWVRTPASEVLYDINPLTWIEGPEMAGAELNLGAVPFGVFGEHETNFHGIYPGLVGARDDRGYLLVSPAKLPKDRFDDGEMMGPLNYHVFDFNLFWMNIRANARARVHAFLLEHEQVHYPLIESSNTAHLSAGTPFTHQIETINQAKVFHADSLPAGLSIDEQNGIISGAVPETGTFAVRLSAENDFGKDVAELAITVE